MSKEMSFSDDDKKVLKNTICKDLTDGEFVLFITICVQAGLNPMLKQIYATKQRGTLVPIVSIDGLRLVAERTGKYAPGSETKFFYDEGKLISATACVKKQTDDGTWHEVKSTAYFQEYCPSNASSTWSKMPHVMLSKCAEAAALRKAFPNELSGLYSKEEMDQAAIPEEEPPSKIPLYIEEAAQILEQYPEQAARVFKAHGVTYFDELVAKNLREVEWKVIVERSRIYKRAKEEETNE